MQCQTRTLTDEKTLGTLERSQHLIAEMSNTSLGQTRLLCLSNYYEFTTQIRQNMKAFHMHLINLPPNTANRTIQILGINQVRLTTSKLKYVYKIKKNKTNVVGIPVECFHEYNLFTIQLIEVLFFFFPSELVDSLELMHFILRNILCTG